MPAVSTKQYQSVCTAVNSDLYAWPEGVKYTIDMQILWYK